MKVTVKLFASFKEYTGIPQSVVDVAPGTTVGDLWDTLVGEHPRLLPLSQSAGFALNGRYTRADNPLSEGDTIAYLPPVSGG